MVAMVLLLLQSLVVVTIWRCHRIYAGMVA